MTPHFQAYVRGWNLVHCNAVVLQKMKASDGRVLGGRSGDGNGDEHSGREGTPVATSFQGLAMELSKLIRVSPHIPPSILIRALILPISYCTALITPPNTNTALCGC